MRNSDPQSHPSKRAFASIAVFLLVLAIVLHFVLDLAHPRRTFVLLAASWVVAFVVDRLLAIRRELRATLRAEGEGRARLRAVTDGVHEALILISTEARVVDVNRCFVETFGVPRERMIDQRLQDLRTLYDQLFEEPEALYRKTVSRSADTEAETTKLVTQCWPERREHQLYSTPISDDHGPLGRLFVFRDVTHEREVDRMKTEFVSLASHELRTPLTSIQGFTEMVLDGDAGEIGDEVREYLEIVANNAERLVLLVNDLLDLSRIESGRIQLERQNVDLRGVVESVTRTLGPAIEEKGQHLSVKIDDEAAAVLGDESKLIQVLTNYVSNATKYTPAGGSIRVELSAEGPHARIAVTDDGYGIAPQDQERLFTRFYRVDGEATRQAGGTGLGLSIVKELIELQGGEVGVRSAEGEGSTFTFTVPRAHRGDR